MKTTGSLLLFVLLAFAGLPACSQMLMGNIPQSGSRPRQLIKFSVSVSEADIMKSKFLNYSSSGKPYVPFDMDDPIHLQITGVADMNMADLDRGVSVSGRNVGVILYDIDGKGTNRSYRVTGTEPPSRYGGYSVDEVKVILTPLEGGPSVTAKISDLLRDGLPAPSAQSEPVTPRNTKPVKSPAANQKNAKTRFVPVSSSMLGKKVNDPVIANWIRRIGASPTISKFDDSYYYSFKANGISLLFLKKTDKLDCIFLYAEGEDKYHQYTGSLPYKLTFRHTRKQVEAMFGPPTAKGSTWASYDAKGIGFDYDSRKPSSPAAVIKFISIYKH